MRQTKIHTFERFDHSLIGESGISHSHFSRESIFYIFNTLVIPFI